MEGKLEYASTSKNFCILDDECLFRLFPDVFLYLPAEMLEFTGVVLALEIASLSSLCSKEVLNLSDFDENQLLTVNYRFMISQLTRCLFAVTLFLDILLYSVLSFCVD